ASLSTAGNTLTINQAGLTATIANQSKTYGADDPSLSGIAVGLSGVVNTTVTNWNGTSTPINDTGNVAGNLQSLTRTVGETVGSYTITGGTLTLAGRPQAITARASALAAVRRWRSARQR